MRGTRRAGRWLAAALVAGSVAAAPAGSEPGANAPAAAAAAGAPTDLADPALAEAPPPPPEPRFSAGHAQLEEVWRSTPGGLLERSRATRAAALQLGIWSFDPGARAILRDPSLGSDAERAEAAALLAPELPDAELALARARLAAFDLGGGFDALLRALGGLRRHPDARGWFEVTLLDVAARSALFGGLLFAFVAGLGCVGRLAIPLSLRLGLPASSSAAALGALLLLPAALGEGLLGVGLACGALALASGSASNRIAVVAGLVLALLGLGPLAAARDRALALLGADPLGAAAVSAERDFASPLDLVRLERAAADGDALARRALALALRRAGDVGASDRLFRTLLEGGEASAAVLNNAANTRFAAGAPREALALYERAAKADPTPLGLFNLAQAYGRAILLEEQELALSQAQALDSRAVHELTLHVAEVGAGGPVDLTLSTGELRARAEERAAGAAGARRSALAPGWLGRSAAAGFAGLGAAIALGAALALPLRRLGAEDDLYAGLARMLRAGKATDPALRMAHLASLRAREAHLARLRRLAAWTVPGAAGLQAGSGTLALGAALLATFAATAYTARGGLVPDALTAAATGAFAFGAAAAAAALGYLALLAAGIARAGRRR